MTAPTPAALAIAEALIEKYPSIFNGHRFPSSLPESFSVEHNFKANHVACFLDTAAGLPSLLADREKYDALLQILRSNVRWRVDRYEWVIPGSVANNTPESVESAIDAARQAAAKGRA